APGGGALAAPLPSPSLRAAGPPPPPPGPAPPRPTRPAPPARSLGRRADPPRHRARCSAIRPCRVP
ncbi:hypothetical protein, partial [Nocardia abscessus]|uniref:hypothetical protein n=1 Tax=Nocardia abscessus TaxID=120957 RepID=UPI0024543F93